MNIKDMLGVKEIHEIKSIVCIQPHPDDNEVGAAGTIAMLAERGCRVVYVTVTDGRFGSTDPNIDPHLLIQIRRKERDEAGQLLGVAKQIELGFKDGGAYSEREVMEALIPILRSEKPEMVLSVDPWMPYEAHPDHYKVGRAVAAAVLTSSTIAFPEAGDPFSIPQVGFYATSYPNTFVDVSSYWDRKLKSILVHDSQFNNSEWPILVQYFTYQAQEQYKAMKKGSHGFNEDQSTIDKGYAESFKVLSTRQLHFFPAAIYS